MDSSIVACPHCGRKNRLPADAGGKTVVCGECKAPLEASGGSPVVLTDGDFAARSSSEGAMVVDFWAAWCGPCRIIAPVIESLAASRRDVVFAKVNVDENPSTAARYGIQSIPTLVFLSRGVEKGRLVGAVGRPQIEQAISRFLGRSA